jgi:hypothetical protein
VSNWLEAEQLEDIQVSSLGICWWWALIFRTVFLLQSRCCFGQESRSYLPRTSTFDTASSACRSVFQFHCLGTNATCSSFIRIASCAALNWRRWSRDSQQISDYFYLLFAQQDAKSDSKSLEKCPIGKRLFSVASVNYGKLIFGKF